MSRHAEIPATQLRFPLAVDAVVIDLDGTLLHTAPDLTVAVNHTLAELNMPPVALETVQTYIGNGVSQLIKRVLTGHMDGEPDAVIFARAKALHEKYYTEVSGQHSHPFPDVVEGLEVLRKTGYHLGCITNKLEKYTEPLLKETGLFEYFDLILCGDSLPRMKPDPLPLLHACEIFATTPDRMLLIGDSQNDTQAARAAGCYVFCVPYGYNHGRDVNELDTDLVVDSLLSATKYICKA